MSEIAIILFASNGYDRAAQGLAGAGRRLADQAGVPLRALVLGQAGPALTAPLARIADRVIVADHPDLRQYQPESCLTALTDLCREAAPLAVLLSNDTYSQEITPRLAHRLGGSAAGDGTQLQLSGDRVRVTRQVYGGKAEALVELQRRPVVAWLRARSFAPAEERAAAGEITRSDVRIASDDRTRIVERKGIDQGEARLEEARVIVSGGRGIGGVEGFRDELQPLAQMLGAQMAASRAACDAGWVPPTWQVGQTGKKVSPDLYLAVAITGASQHMAGVSEARNIVAINIDPDAPIFKHARYGIVEDYRKVVPLLREKLAALQK